MLVTNLNDSGVGSLRDAIANAAPGATITFDPSLANQTITLTSGEIFVAPGKNLTIDGSAAANLRISGGGSSRIFRFGSNVDFQSSDTIRNLILADGFSSDRGGAVQTEDLGNLTVNGVTFENNVAVNGGASIWTNGRSGGVTVLNSRFLNNQATAGNNERGSGGIAFIGFDPSSALVVRNSEFTGNQGINGAAINVINGHITIENTQFRNNNTTAASFDTGQPRDFLRGYGGALYVDRVNDSLVIRDSLFEGNRAEGEGGAAYLFADPGDTVQIERTTFRDNQVAALTGGGGLGNGGAVAHVRNSRDAAGSFIVTDSSFVNNLANHQGGGLWVNQSNSTITNSTFSNNQAPNNFGGAITTYSPLTVTGVTIADNSAEFAGAIAQGSDNLVTATNTLFVNNTSTNTGVSFNRNEQTNRPMNDGGGNIQFPPGPEIIPGITISDPGTNQAPTVTAPASFAIDESMVAPILDLRATGTDPDGDTLRVTNLTLTAGEALPLTDNGNGTFTVDTSVYRGLAEGVTRTATYSYNLDDGKGGTVAQTATVTIAGRPGLYWHRDVWNVNNPHQLNGRIAVWQIDSAGQSVDGNYLTDANGTHMLVHPDFWTLAGVGKISGDGLSDLIWRYIGSNVDVPGTNSNAGHVAIWSVNNDSTLFGYYLTQTQPDLNWELQATADYDGDGDDDLIWRNQATGVNEVWRMEGGQFQDEFTLNVPVLPAEWEIGGVGDFDGDGRHNDILWRNDISGDNALWFMNDTDGLTVEAAGVFGNLNPAFGWRVEGVADVNGDGTSDIFWRNLLSSSNSIWLMQSAATPAAVSVLAADSFLTPGAGWTGVI